MVYYVSLHPTLIEQQKRDADVSAAILQPSSEHTQQHIQCLDM